MEKVGYYCWWQILVNLKQFCRKIMLISSMYGDRSIFLQQFFKICLVTVLNVEAPFMQTINLIIHCTAMAHPSK